MRRAAVAVGALLIAGPVAAVPPVGAGGAPPAAADGRGDPLFPALGGGGYDVDRYDIALTVELDGTVAATTEITAVATAPLAAVSLDLAGLAVAAVRAAGREVGHERSGRDLVVSLPRPVAAGERFTLAVDTIGVPTPETADAAPYAAGWQVAGDGTRYAFNEPDGAATWFPSDDHPSDRATVRLTVRAPAGWTAVSAGAVPGEGSGAVFEPGRTATYLVPLAVGPLVPERVGGHPVWRPAGTDPALLAPFARQEEILAFFAGLLGPYPGTYSGSLVVADDLPAALETAGLPTYTTASLALGETVVVHEIAHQWFGGAVGIEAWPDVWLKEGLATFAEWLWAEHTAGPDAYTAAVASARRRLASGPYPAPAAPPADDLYNPAVYVGSALGWAAVRERVGPEAFAAFLAALVETFTDRLVSTDELLAFVGSVLGPSAESTLRTAVLP